MAVDGTAGQSSSVMRSVERALDVVDVLSESGQPLRLAEVARRTGLHIATAQRILRTLERREFVANSSSGYSAGPAVLAAAHSYLVGNQLVLAATPVLQELADALGLTASLSVRLGRSRVLVARVEGASPLRYQLPVGGRLPLHLGAGKVFLAFMDADERAEALGGLADFVTAGGERVAVDEFEGRLDDIVSRGYAVSRNERAVGAASVSAPVRSAAGDVIAVVQVTGSDADLSGDVLERMSREVINAAASISDRYR